MKYEILSMVLVDVLARIMGTVFLVFGAIAMFSGANDTVIWYSIGVVAMVVTAGLADKWGNKALRHKQGIDSFLLDVSKERGANEIARKAVEEIAGQYSDVGESLYKTWAVMAIYEEALRANILRATPNNERRDVERITQEAHRALRSHYKELYKRTA